jgi:hypothetical protein
MKTVIYAVSMSCCEECPLTQIVWLYNGNDYLVCKKTGKKITNPAKLRKDCPLPVRTK